MKSLTSIIEKMSPSEIEMFRVILKSNSRSEKNKKLELFDNIVDRKFRAEPSHLSRQSVYQLKKRLQDQLYSFLISQEQMKTSDNQLFLEMDCHKKLYCFKILFDKGIHDHALQVLDEVVSISSKNSLHGLYLDAVNLQNMYFPLKRRRSPKDIAIGAEIKNLNKSLSRNLYLNVYVIKSTTQYHESDQSFRQTLINEFINFDVPENEALLETLMEINQLFLANDFFTAHRLLTKVYEEKTLTGLDENILRLILIELTKSSLCIDDMNEASHWLHQAESLPGKLESFLPILLELRFIVAFRMRKLNNLNDILRQSEAIPAIATNEALHFKWNWFHLIANFENRKYKDVVRLANANAAFSTKSKHGIVHVKALELLAIYQMNDYDWLSYKIDSLRKYIGGMDDKLSRIVQLFVVIKNHVVGRPISETYAAIDMIDQQSPWHPLSTDLLNYCEFFKSALTKPYIIKQNLSIAAEQ